MAGNKKRSYCKGKKNKAAEQPITEKELHRFAGSSEEEDSDDNDNDNDNDSTHNEEDDDIVEADHDGDSGDEAVDMKGPSPSSKHTKKNKRAASHDDDDEEDEGAVADEEGEEEQDDSDDSDDDFDQYENQQRQKHGSAGMASAMAKILGPAITSTSQSQRTTKKQKISKSSTGSAVLSKTTTPLQRELQKEKELAKAMREKRREKAVNPLPALHIPLSVATTSITVGATGSKGVTQELEQERLHRRVATRGVVALFNAVAQHQKKGPADSLPTASSKSTEQVKKMTKHGFLDMIKTAAVGKGSGGTANNDNNNTNNNNKDDNNSASKPKGGASPSGNKWAAIQDDYMLNPKKVRNSQIVFLSIMHLFSVRIAMVRCVLTCLLFFAL